MKKVIFLCFFVLAVISFSFAQTAQLSTNPNDFTSIEPLDVVEFSTFTLNPQSNVELAPVTGMTRAYFNQNYYFGFTMPANSDVKINIKYSDNVIAGLAAYIKKNGVLTPIDMVLLRNSTGSFTINQTEANAGQNVLIRLWFNQDMAESTIQLALEKTAPVFEERAILVDPNYYTPEQLVQDVLINGCLTASNVTYTGSNDAIGYFAGNIGTTGFNDGIILTSGEAVIAQGPDDQSGAGESNGTGSDIDLAALNPGFDIHDAAVLEFDFVPASDTLVFQYIFGSEEFPEYANGSFNDVFGFFLSGPGINGPYSNNSINIAELPNGQPVTIDNLFNSGLAPGGYYVGATTGNGSTGSAYNNDIQYDGASIPLTATALVQACETYHIKLAIGDAGDGAFDSGVFFKASSFTSGVSYTVSTFNAWDNPDVLYEGCSTYLVFSRVTDDNIDQAVEIPIIVSGTATEGADYSDIPDVFYIQSGHMSDTLFIEGIADGIPEGTETISFEFTSGCPCDPTASNIVINLEDELDWMPTITNTGPICTPGDSVTLTLNFPDSIDLSLTEWHWLLDNSNGTTLVVYPTETTTYELEFSYPCTTLTLNTTVIFAPSDATITPFGPLCQNADPVAIEVANAGGTFSITPNNPGALSNGVFYPENAGAGTHTITYSIEGECPAQDQISVEVYENISIENFEITCNGTSTEYNITFDVTDGNGNATAFQVNSGNGFTNFNGSYDNWLQSPSNYSLTVTDMNGCNEYILEGFKDCGCVTNAGTMSSLELVTLCQGGTTGGLVMHNGNQATDDNDVFEYILHDGSVYPATNATIFARRNDLDFGFSVGMTYGTTYYISAICGNNSGGHVDNGDGCYSQSVGTPVMWLENPIANISESNIDVCGKEVDLEGNAPGTGMIGTWSSASGSFVPTQGTDIHDNNISLIAGLGDWVFTWTVNNGPCSSFDQVTVHFKEIPTPFAGNDTVVCGSQIELNGDQSILGSSLSWSASEVNFNNASVENPTATLNSGTYGAYVLTLSESFGTCSGSDNMIVTFIEEPQPIILGGVSADTVCGINANLGVQNAQNPGEWTAFTSAGVQIYPNFTPSSTSPMVGVQIGGYDGTFYDVDFVWTEVNSSQGLTCEGSATKRIVFARTPNASITTVSQETCGSEIALEANTTGSEWADGKWVVRIPIAHQFTPNDTDPNTTLQILSDVAYGDTASIEVPIMWQMTSGGCASTAETVVTFYRTPEANAGADNEICGLSYPLEAVFSLPSTANYTPEGYWQNIPALNPAGSVVNFVNPNLPTTSVNVSTPGEYYFVWRENNANNTFCTDRDTVKILFKESPIIDAGDDFHVCGQSTDLSGISAGFDFSWTSTNSGVAFDNYQDPNTEVNVGNYGDYVFIAQESNGTCVSRDSLIVTFWRRPDAVELVDDLDTLVCGRVFERLRAQNPGEGVTGTWISEPGNGVSFYNNSYNDTVEVTTYGYYNMYWVEYTGPDTEGPGFCNDTSDAVSLHFVELPEANAGLDTVFCGLEGSMNAELSVNSSTGVWSSSSGNISFGDLNDPNSTVTSAVYTDPQTYPYFQFIWTEDNMTCSNSDTVIVRFEKVPSSDIVVVPPKCYGQSASILSTVDSLPIYDWTWDGGQIDSIFTPNALGGVYHYLVSWPNTEDTIHTISLTTESSAGCRSLITEALVEEPYNPQIETSIFPDTCALGLGGFEFISDALTSFPSFSWVDTTGAIIPVAEGDTIFNLFAGTYSGIHSYRTFNTEYITDYNDLGWDAQCVDTFTFVINPAGMVTADIAISAATDMTSLVAPSAEVWFDNLSDADNVSTSCTWYFGDGETMNSCEDQVNHVYVEPNECYEPYFVIKVRNKPECRDTAFLDCIKVDDRSLMEIPNIFTPNGDGVNDYFQVKAQTLQSFKGVIVNRWGSTVYEWTDYESEEAGWDGKLNGGGKASSGVYYYIIKAVGMDGLEYEETGPLQLVREK